MGRKDISEAESTDLLLDTMCNAFGGIILIAILISIISGRNTSVEPANIQPGDNSDAYLEMRIDSLTRSLERIRRQSANVHATSSKKMLEILDHSEQVASADEIRAEHANLQTQLSTSLRTLQQLQNEADKYASNALGLFVPESADIVKRNLAIPEMRYVKDKYTHFLAFSGGKLYPVSAINTFAGSAYDNAHVAYQNIPSHKVDVVELRPFGGFSGEQAIHRYFKKLTLSKSSTTYYLDCHVLPDSFDSFIQARDIFREYGYLYNWSPGTEKRFVIMSVEAVKAQ